MALLLYVCLGLMISVIFMTVPLLETKSSLPFLLLTILWLPLLLLGIILISIQEPYKYIT